MTRRPGYYGETAVALRVIDTDATARDIMPASCDAKPPTTVRGAGAIAEILGISTAEVYAIIRAYKKRNGGPPMAKVPGLGIVGDQAALTAWRDQVLRVSHRA